MFGTSKAERDAEFTHFVTQAQPSLSGTAWLLTGNRDAAAELVQAALVKTYVAWPKVRRDDALAYARRILVNENIDRWRSRRPEVLDDGPALGQVCDDQTQQQADHDELTRLVRQLPEGQRKVIILRYFCDMSERWLRDGAPRGVSLSRADAGRG